MIYRAFIGFTIAMGLAACSSNTTSLGSQASATSAGGDDADSGPVLPDGDSDAGCSGNVFWQWYVWPPIATETPCEYLLPEPPGPPSVPEPQLDPATWNPNNVRVESNKSVFAYFKESSAGCDGDASDGWYYAPTEGSATPTRFIICPKTCATVTSNDGAIAIAATFSSCQP
jgi:hypothetical protein